MTPKLDEICNDVLYRMSGGTLTMRWDTQRELKGGGLAEDIMIWFRKLSEPITRERDASTASGGEKQLLQAANRIGLCIWSASLGKPMPQMLFFDEAGNNTDDEMTAQFVEELGRVADQFRAIVLVTPKRVVADMVAHRIELSPIFGGVDVEYIGNGIEAN